ncbi:MAG: hypothetical protein AAF567_06995 [Actinomycetota bacterium]
MRSATDAVWAREYRWMVRKLVLVEGVPGSGKTTTSWTLAESYRNAGHEVGWALEEDRQHPFFDQQFRRSHRSDDFPERCLHAWRSVVDASLVHPWVLEGVAFQSTVRFMFEQDLPERTIEAYWDDFVATVRPVAPLFVHLLPRDVESFIRGHTMNARSDVWGKISAHVLSTPVGRRLDGDGRDVAVDFWILYSELCVRLARRSEVAALEFDVGRGWAGIDEAVAEHAGLTPS